jgi:hypothetical protein
MKLQRTPLILLISAILLGAIVFLLEQQKPLPQSTATQQTSPLFSFKEADVKALTITTPNQTLAFEEVPAAAVKQQPSPSPSASPTPKATATTKPTVSPSVLPNITPDLKGNVWQMTQPQKVLANKAAIAFLLNTLTTGQSQAAFAMQPSQQAEFGFDKPLATIEVKLATQTSHRLILGKPNFNRSGIYAQIDPPAQPGKETIVRLAPIDLESAVTRSLPEWQELPPTPSPSASPSPSSTSSPSPSSQPTN